MDKIDLQIELCRHAVKVLRQNAREKVDADELLDMAENVLLQTLDAFRKGMENGKEKQERSGPDGSEDVQ